MIDTQSTKNLPAPMAVATVVNCSLWFSFGAFVIEDAFIYAPNFLGLASGVTQCGLLLKYGIHKDELDAGNAKLEVNGGDKSEGVAKQ